MTGLRQKHVRLPTRRASRSLFIAANNQLQSPSAEDDVLSSAGRDQIAADEDEREQHQDEIEWSEGDERHGR